MKALILAAGRGSRLGHLSAEQNKCVLPVFGRPLIEYSLDCVSALSQINEIVIVVGYRAEDIINLYGTQYRSTPIRYVIQWEQSGVVGALEYARPALERQDFMLLLGDEFLFNARHREMLETFEEEELYGVCGVVRVRERDLVRRTYSILQDSSSRIEKLVEKPEHPIDDIMGTGNCIFRGEFLDHIESTPINPGRGEKELPDLIQCAIDAGNVVKSFLVCDQYVNVNTPREIGEIRDLDSYFTHF